MKTKEFVTTGAFIGSLISVGLFYLIDGNGHYLSRGIQWENIPLRVVWFGALVMWAVILLLLGERKSGNLAVLAVGMLVGPDLLVSLQEQVSLLTFPVYTKAMTNATYWTAAGCILVAVLLDAANWWDNGQLIESKVTIHR